MPESAIKFGSFEAAKKHLAQLEGHGNSKKINPYSKFVAGGFAGIMSQSVVFSIKSHGIIINPCSQIGRLSD